MTGPEAPRAAAPARPSALRRAVWRALGARSFSKADVPPPVVAPDAPVRLYIAPVNSAGQGYRWARAAETLPGVAAVDMQHRTPRDFGFPADYALPTAAFLNSRSWQKAQFRAVSTGFTHVLMESARPMFGGLFGDDVEREVAALRAAGVKVAMVLHGSDLQQPSRHALAHEFSPFKDGEWDRTDELERQSLETKRLLGALGLPVFVSTPDLLDDWPAATILPVVIDVDAWLTDAPLLEREVPVVVHAPSSGAKKGTSMVHDTMTRLAAEGLVDYREFSGVPAAEMPALIAGSDIVLDQFRIGVYGVADAEAMAAGRLVLSYASESVRERVRAQRGLELPIVEVTPATLEATLRDVLARRDHYRAFAATGLPFARAVHDGTASAEALRGFLAPPA